MDKKRGKRRREKRERPIEEGEKKMNYATNRKMLVTMKLEAIVLLHLSSLSFPRSFFVFPLLQDKEKKEGGEGGRKKKTKRNREL